MRRSGSSLWITSSTCTLAPGAEPLLVAGPVTSHHAPELGPVNRSVVMLLAWLPTATHAETRAWLEANCPPEMREPVRGEDDIYWGGRNATFKNDAQKAWLEACIAKGYTVPMWPKEYGGAGLGITEAALNALFEARDMGVRIAFVADPTLKTLKVLPKD